MTPIPRSSPSWARLLGTVAAAVALLVSAVGCSSGDGSGPGADLAIPGYAIHSVGGERGVHNTAGYRDYPVGVVDVGLMDTVVADRDVELVDVRPLRMDDRVELLAVLFNSGGHPGYTCRTAWPPDGLGEAKPIEGFQLPEGRGGSFIVYIRAPAGDYLIEGLEILYRYHENGILYRQEFETTTLDVHYRDTKAEIEAQCQHLDYPHLSNCGSGDLDAAIWARCTIHRQG